MNDYIFEYNLDIEDVDKMTPTEVAKAVTPHVLSCALGTFTNVDVGAGLIMSDQSCEYKEFTATAGDMSTDWILDVENVAVHGIYPCEGKELKIIFIYKDKPHGFNLKPHYFYLFPFWLTHKFESLKEETCGFIHYKLPFEKRLITKDKKVWW
jgi:hypothetical protein